MKPEDLSEMQDRVKKWKESYPADEEFDSLFTTVSGEKIEPLYTPLDVAEVDPVQDLGLPGEFPFTRGIHRTMYRGRTWTMRQFAGFATAVETNQRYKFLLSRGQTGLSVAFDFPTLMGYDSDHDRSLGEVGRCGVAIASLADMQTLFDGIPMGEITTSMTVNGPAAVLLCFYIAAAEKQGYKFSQCGGTIQNDILKEYMAQNAWIFPPTPSMRLITDIFGFCSREVPKWNTVSISGYHIREAGSSALQELAFTLKNGITYVEAGIAAGLDVDQFAPRLSFFFNSHIDFFEEIAKFRAARKIWAQVMRDRFKAKDPRSWMLRFHTQTAGCSLTAQQPMNNIIRTAYECLSAILGGTQSLHANSMDEVLALPTEKAVEISLRTQQILASETGITNTMDPMAGSYFVEALTKRMELGANDYFRKIDEQGGVIKALEKGFFQKEISDASYRYQKEVESKKKIVVGVNDYVTDESLDIEILKIDSKVEETQRQRLADLRRSRDNREMNRALKALNEAARGTGNLIPFLLDAVKAYATLGEVVAELKDVFGEYKEPIFF